MLSARFHALREAQKKTASPDSDDDEDVDSTKSEESNKDSDDGNESSSDKEETKSAEEVEEDEEEEETQSTREKNDTSVPELNTSLTFVCEALGDFAAEESSDLSFSKGDLLTVISMRDDGWWEVENQDGGKGMVPSTFLKIPEKIKKCVEGSQTTSQSEEKGKLWEKLRSTVKQVQMFEGAVTAIGALPVGFCKASLMDLLIEDFRYSTEAFLAPKLSDSGLSFKDIKWSNSTNSLKPLTARLQRAVRLVAFRQVQPPGSGFDVTSHHVRICLHDGSKVLSNIHTIRAHCDPKVPKIWTFLPKISSGGCSLEEGQFFIRSNSSSATIGVLFQLCVSYKKVATGETGEMSCGWVFMRLLDDSGLAVPNRTKILHIHPGMPFISQQNSPFASGSKGSALKHFMNRSKQPRLVVTITQMKRKTDDLLNFLPTTLIGPVSAIPLLVLYRKIVTDKLFRDRISFDSTELIQSPFLSNFPKLFSQPDILDAFRKLWNDKCKKLKQLKNENERKTYFQQLFLETAFLMIQCSSLPPFCLGNEQIEQTRKLEIAKICKTIKERGPLSFTLSSEYHFRPLSIETLSLDFVAQSQFPIKGIE